MVEFHGHHNSLTSFSMQPKMVEFDGNHNSLTSFSVQHQMIHFSGDNIFCAVKNVDE